MNQINFRKIGGWLTIVFFLLGCGVPFFSLQPAPAPETQSFDALGTIIAATAAKAQTQTATLLPSPTASLTPSPTPTVATPTPTFYFSILTATPPVPVETSDPGYSFPPDSPFTLDLSTAEPIPYSGKPWTCVVRGVHPARGAIVEGGKEFHVTWTVLNTGWKMWTTTTIDFIYKSGYRHEGKPIQDLWKNVPPGKTIDLVVLFKAPKRAGEYTAIWTLKVGRYSFCGMRTVFIIED